MGEWQPMKTAPKDRFILLWCPEDQSRWFAKWQQGEWYGVDDDGLTRSGQSTHDPDYVTGWFVDAWQPSPLRPPPSGTCRRRRDELHRIRLNHLRRDPGLCGRQDHTHHHEQLGQPVLSL